MGGEEGGGENSRGGVCVCVFVWSKGRMRLQSVALKPKMHAIKLLGKDLEMNLIGWHWIIKKR